jgi:hypothetical protein
MHVNCYGCIILYVISPFYVGYPSVESYLKVPEMC